MMTPASSIEEFSSEFKLLLDRNNFQGDVRSDPVTRILYSTDASIYQIEPKLVVIPKVLDDLEAIVQAANEVQAPITARGSGSGLAGQAIGESIIIDCSRHLTRIMTIDPESRLAVVEPGVILSDLNKKCSGMGIQFGPDPASAERATLGGCIANNASGAHSILYGMTGDHIENVEVVLSDSSTSIFSAIDLNEAHKKAEENSLSGNIYKASLRIRDEFKDEITTRWPHTWRRVSGYNLNYLIPWSPSSPPLWSVDNPSPYPPLKPGTINLAHLFAGSEGTLGIIKRATIRLVPKPVNTVLGVLAYTSVVEACDAIPELLSHSPAAIELIPRSLIDLARSLPAYADHVDFISQPDETGKTPEALLVLEFCGEDKTKLIKQVHQLGKKAFLAESPASQKRVWAVRKVGLGILMSRPGSRKPIAFIEDMAVPVERLGYFVREMDTILKAHGTHADYYAHASAGCLHIRPILSLRSPESITALRSIAEQAVELTLSVNGAVSAEHGDGIARSEWLEKAYGPKILQAFREIKLSADPHGLMNPGKIVDPLPMDRNLRYGSSYLASAWQPVFEPVASLQMAPEANLIDTIEQCNGAGVCRKSDGVMCPSFQASQEEMHSTRGRANLLRAMISGKFPNSGMAEKSVREALDLCLACKGCKSECPSGVDIAKLKYEFLDHFYSQETNKRPIRDYMFGYFDALARLGYTFLPISDWILQSGLFGFLEDKMLGLSSERKFPVYAKKSLSAQWNRYIQKKKGRGREKVIFMSDAFTEYFHTGAGFSALKLLRLADCDIHLMPLLGSGRTLISKGFLRSGKKHAEKVIQLLKKIDPTGKTPVVSVEPSEIYTLRDEYADFFPDDIFVASIAKNAWMIDEFLIRPNESGVPRLKLVTSDLQPPGKKVLLHGHCYQKAQPPSPDGYPTGVSATVNFLNSAGFSTEVIDAGCCGMAGAFGYEKNHYAFSIKVGELALFPAIKEELDSDPEVFVAASGVSCQTQIKDGVGCVSLHPTELFMKALTEA